MLQWINPWISVCVKKGLRVDVFVSTVLGEHWNTQELVYTGLKGEVPSLVEIPLQMAKMNLL